MLNALVLIILVLAAVLFVLFVALCLAIRKEDRDPYLTTRPPTIGAAITRRIAGLTVRRPAEPLDIEADAYIALSESIYPAEDHEGR
jgi:hypothetical protein